MSRFSLHLFIYGRYFTLAHFTLLDPKLWHYRMRNINLELKIRNLKFQILDI